MNNIDHLVEKGMKEFKRFGFVSHTMPNAIGMFENEQKTLMFHSIIANPDYPYLEIGSFCGGSAIIQMIGRSLNIHQQNTTERLFPWIELYCIDRNTGDRERFDANLSVGNYQDRVKRFYEESKDFNKFYPKENISFAFIDGYHSYKYVIMDFEHIYPYLINGSCVLFHDQPLNKQNYQTYLNSSKENHEKWINDTSETTQEQNFVIAAACAYLIDKYHLELIEQPLSYQNNNSLTIVRKP